MLIHSVFKTCILTLSLCIALIIQTGCAPVIIPTGVASTGVIVSQERSVNDNVRDKTILTKIKGYYAYHNINDVLLKVNVNVFEGRVMLTGSVISEIYVRQAEEWIWSINGVKEVINEIVVEPNYAIQHTVEDKWIESQIDTKLFLEKSIQTANYIVKVNSSIVYLLGVAQNEKELNSVLRIVSRTNGVKKVVNHVMLKTDPRRCTNNNT